MEDGLKEKNAKIAELEQDIKNLEKENTELDHALTSAKEYIEALEAEITELEADNKPTI